MGCLPAARSRSGQAHWVDVRDSRSDAYCREHFDLLLIAVVPNSG